MARTVTKLEIDLTIEDTDDFYIKRVRGVLLSGNRSGFEDFEFTVRSGDHKEAIRNAATACSCALRLLAPPQWQNHDVREASDVIKKHCSWINPERTDAERRSDG